MSELPKLVSGPAPDEPFWNSYPVLKQAQRSYSRAVFAAECALAVLTEEVLTIIDYQAPGHPNDPRGDFRSTYSKLREWKLSLPYELYTDGSALPSVTFLL